jgi:microtubule-associated protein 1 light chain
MAKADQMGIPSFNGNGFVSASSSSQFYDSKGHYIPFKERRTFEMRQKDVMEIKKKHPYKVPLIIERGKNEKVLKMMDKTKFLVPEEITMSQLIAILRKRLEVSETQTFYLIVNNKSMASGHTTLGEIYKMERDADGFLYLTFSSQEMFG